MPDTEVTVHVNRESTGTLETAASALEVDGSFSLRLKGHSAPAHAHCRLAGDLERIAALEEGNYYVEPNAVTTVPVAVDADGIDGPVEGTLEVLTGYGAESITIPVTVVPGPSAVDVDDSLAEPASPEPASAEVEQPLARLIGGLEPATLAVAALGLVAIGVGGATAATIGGPVTAAGLVIVFVGVAVALLLLVR
ncbi:hypothetical protein C488_12843 [Natrinema pellirubrum DSM 15624]|uniref:Uncharacterized protein n=1 Tax=Natrinema pellirubrum (strain DSM 15624 / CIP 106293 / JCM 10476 / NCIMB 786 / 157) TaxID=797303 RepID=L0JNX7_NATP1|nr:hypothetical protein [Natrinema pellirubrum]AGB32553.1 hypothetical protein Natpe_2751 [Natrinema pellirubrum DSM 15624]ELY73689.1 hypothetical protein C488_12843 [Natrinema pellirubrum DSM 15624]